MFTAKRRLFPSTLAALTLLVSSLISTPPAQAQPEDSDGLHGLVGAWWVTVTQYDCSTGVKRPPFSSLLLFSRGGTLTEATSNPGFLAGQRSTGVGTWARSEGRTYTANDVAFILFTGGPFQQGTQKLIHTITLDHDDDSFTDQATVQFFNSSGTLLMQGCASASANRLK